MVKEAARCMAVMREGRCCASADLMQESPVLIADHLRGSGYGGLLYRARFDRSNRIQISRQRSHGSSMVGEGLDQVTPGIVQDRAGEPGDFPNTSLSQIRISMD